MAKGDPRAASAGPRRRSSTSTRARWRSSGRGTGGLRDPGPRVLGPAGVPHLPRRPPLLPRRPDRAGALEVMMKWVGARFGERQSALIEGELASVERASRAAEATQVGADLFPLAADLEAARSQMAFTLGFHIILACLGVAFPAIILIANYIGLRRGDEVALGLAQRWSKVAAVTLRGRRDHRHGAVVRDGPAVAGVHGPLRRGLRPCLRARGDLLLHSRRSSSPSTSSAGSACQAVGALLDRRPGRDRRPRRRLLGRRGRTRG